MAIDNECEIKLDRTFYSKHAIIISYLHSMKFDVGIYTIFGHTFIRFANKKDMVTFKMEFL